MVRQRLSGIAIISLSLAACSQGAGAPDLSAAPTTQAAPVAAPAAVPATAAAQYQSYTFRMGPYSLPAKSSVAKEVMAPEHLQFHVDAPLWVTTFEPSIEDASGNKLPGSLLHLAVVSNHTESNPLCSGERTPLPFAAATSSLQAAQLPEGFGYAVVPEDKLEATVILRNVSEEEYPQVYFRFTLRGEPMNSQKAMQDLLPLLLETDPCRHEPIAVEPGSFVNAKERFAMPAGGQLIAAYGLLQDYGVEVAITKDGEGVPFWRAMATVNADHQVTDLPNYSDTNGVKLQTGDGLVLSAAYQNFSNHWLDYATAGAMVYIARHEENTSPSAAKPYTQKRATAAATGVQTLLMR